MKVIIPANQVKSFTSNDITSLVPCLAVKGTNLMISRGAGDDGSGYKTGDGLSAYYSAAASLRGRDGCLTSASAGPVRGILIVRFITKSNGTVVMQRAV